MTRRPPRNVAASVRARLLNRSRATGEDFQFLFHRYAAERFLYRLGRSAHRDRYVLKGAMLFALWGGSLYRPTRDLDFAAYGSSELVAVTACFREICLQAVPDDGMHFDAQSLRAEPMRQEAEYHGLRVVLDATLAVVRVRMQVDIGFGDAIEPPANDVDYPTLLDSPAPNVRAYPREAVVAEKLHALVLLGERSTRLKDVYDLHALALQFPFDGERLACAIAATFERRRTGIETALPAGLAPRFFADLARAERWRAYLTRNGLPGAPKDFAAAGELILAFLGPIWRALAERRAFGGIWPPAGPWTLAPLDEDPVR
jgi:predicted nucleotidyltransferase component of viral defense system